MKLDKKEYVVKCSHNNCKWIFRSSYCGKTKMFKIRKICSGHMCSMNIVLESYRQMSCSIVSNCISYKYTSLRIEYTPNDMLHKYGLSMNYVKAWRSHEQKLELIRGDLMTPFQLLPSYLYILQQMNMWTVTRVETNQLDRFKYALWLWKHQLQVEKYCRPVIVIDGTYLNGYYGVHSL